MGLDRRAIGGLVRREGAGAGTAGSPLLRDGPAAHFCTQVGFLFILFPGIAPKVLTYDIARGFVRGPPGARPHIIRFKPDFQFGALLTAVRFSLDID